MAYENKDLNLFFVYTSLFNISEKILTSNTLKDNLRQLYLFSTLKV